MMKKTGGLIMVINKDATIFQSFYHIRSDENSKGYSHSFNRPTYRFKQYPNFVLLHYFGDHASYKPIKNGNNKQIDSAPYLPTKPSVINMLKNQLQNEEPNIVYKKMTHSNPRNLKQSQNLRYNIRKKKYLPKESICYLHVLNDEFHFAHEITTHQELRVVIFDTELISVISLLFDIDSNKIDFMLQYDTTFNLCEYFVSPLIIRLHTVCLKAVQ